MSLSALTAAPAQAAVDTSTCVAPALSQPFVGTGDTNWYMLAPGQDANGFSGAGWTLGGGAGMTPETLPGGTTGRALDLPSGATAVSPAICVTSAYLTARAVAERVHGSGGVSFAVSYAGAAGWGAPHTTGALDVTGGGWAPTAAVPMQPATVPGWQLVRIVLTEAPHSESRVADLLVDPRMGH